MNKRLGEGRILPFIEFLEGMSSSSLANFVGNDHREIDAFRDILYSKYLVQLQNERGDWSEFHALLSKIAKKEMGISSMEDEFGVYHVVEFRKGVNRMNKRFRERKGDYKDLLENYASEYMDELGYSEDTLYSMWDFDTMLEGTNPFDIARMVFYGETYGEKGQSFNTNCEYFTFAGDGNLLGVFDYDVESYYEDYFEYEDFVNWCADQGYIEKEDYI